ncbi:amidohydrolase family protein [Desulfatirhabdium butyrativorans]|uniref:amidohydrolase family protein n=1 Tax=Desulfatirhabdium butyrativorans TaxID=340467 RepID=UPI000427A091|nr:amidohydrolase family protein [Desulfatirhabdium butyrativorans]
MVPMEENGSARPDETIIIRAGWLIDGKGDAPLRDRIIEIKNGEIRSVRPGYSGIFCGEGASVCLLDWQDATVMPAWIDCHVHLGMSGTCDADERKAQLQADEETLRPVIERHLGAYRQWGVVAVRHGGDRFGLALRYCREKRLSKAGLPIQVACAAAAWHRQGRYGSLIGHAPAPGLSLAQAIERALSVDPQDRPDHVKIVQSGLNSLTHFGHESAPQFSLEELRQAVAVTRNAGLPVMVHANGREPVDLAVKAGCGSIEHGFFIGRDVLLRMADAGTVWVPTAVTMKAYAEALPAGSLQADIARRTLDEQIRQLRLARQFGVRVAMGTDAGSMGVHHGRSYLEEFRLFLAAGYTVGEAAGCAARQGAALLGLDRLGTIEAGKQAVLVKIGGGPEMVPNHLEHLAVADFTR